MMTYDEIFDLSLEMLMTLSLKRDSECKKIKGFCNQLKKIEIRNKKINKEHRLSSKDNRPTNNYSKIKQTILEAKLEKKNKNIKEIIKRNNMIMVSRIIRISKKIKRHSEIVKERIQIRKEVFHESTFADKSRVMIKLTYEIQQKTELFNNLRTNMDIN